MKKRISLGAVSLLVGIRTMTLSGLRDHSGSDLVRGQFVGAWRLAALEEEGATGKSPAKSLACVVFYKLRRNNAKTQTWKKQLRSFSSRPRLHGHELLLW